MGKAAEDVDLLPEVAEFEQLCEQAENEINCIADSARDYAASLTPRRNSFPARLN